jgi:hypothetical protein
MSESDSSGSGLDGGSGGLGGKFLCVLKGCCMGSDPGWGCGWGSWAGDCGGGVPLGKVDRI